MDSTTASSALAPDDAACLSSHPPSLAAGSASRVSSECKSDVDECSSDNGLCYGRLADRTCEPNRFVVSADAAICIAKANGLLDGLAASDVELVYHSGYKRVVWTIRNVLSDRVSGRVPGAKINGCDSSGQLFIVDAVTGAILGGEQGWCAIA